MGAGAGIRSTDVVAMGVVARPAVRATACIAWGVGVDSVARARVALMRCCGFVATWGHVRVCSSSETVPADYAISHPYSNARVAVRTVWGVGINAGARACGWCLSGVGQLGGRLIALVVLAIHVVRGGRGGW